MDAGLQARPPLAAADCADDAVAAPRRGAWARYALQPRLALIPAPRTASDETAGGLVFSLRPLMAMRLNGQAFALLSAVADGGRTADTAARAAGLSSMDAAAFLDSLARRRLLVRTPPPPGCWPQVSIIVAARERHRATRACVDSLLALRYPGEHCEVIVVDDAS